MNIRLIRLALLVFIGGAAVSLAANRAADDYVVDTEHAAATFRISHLGLSWTHGRFKGLSGKFVVDAANPANSRFELSARVDTVDTDNAKRDEHLRGPDFFNVKQFPMITFKSTLVKPVENGFQVTGDLTLHGVTKPVTFPLLGGRSAEFPKGVKRTGYTGELTIKRSQFGMDKMTDFIGDEVPIVLSFEGTKK